jgi:glucokinase
VSRVPTTVGVDLGGTKILTVAVVGGEVVATAKRSTPREGTPADVLARVGDAIDRLDVGGKKIHGHIVQVGLGAPGPGAPGGTTVGPAPNLPGWDHPVDVVPALSERYPDAEIRVDNDVNVAAFAEAKRGAGRGKRDLLAVFVGTGVGGGVVLDGDLRRGASGLAGEIGHIQIVPGGEPCGCGGTGHVEAYAGRAGIERIARRRHAAGEATALVELAGDGRMKSSVVAAALAEGDAMAIGLVADAARAVGQAIASVSLIVDIGTVAIGGGLAERLGEPFLTSIGDACRDALPWAATPEIVPTRLGDDAGAVGAALLFDLDR